MSDAAGARRILFVLTHRLGDLLQAFPAFALARRALPEAKLHLVCDDSCVPLAALCPDLDRLHVFPRTKLLPGSALGPNRKAELVADLASELRGAGFTDVVNLMGNPSAALIGALAGDAPRRGGRCFGPSGLEPVEQRWARILLALPAARAWQPFHLSEVFSRLTAETLAVPPALVLPGVAVDRLRGLDTARKMAGQGEGDWLALRRPWIGLQGGASKSLRRPPGAWLRTFGREFLGQVGGSLFLLGTAAEGEAFEPLLQALGPSQRRRCVNMCGRVDVPGLAALVSNLDATVSVDTFTLHLSAAVGTPVLGLYPGKASPHETGPWGGGHLVLWAEGPHGPCDCTTQCGSGGGESSECWERLHPELAVGALGILLSKGDTDALRGRRVRAMESCLSDQVYTLKSVDGLREREPEEEALASLARAWATGMERPKIHVAQEVRRRFLATGEALLGAAGQTPTLGAPGDPPNWFRAQALHARGEAGGLSRSALADIAAGCAFFGDSVQGAPAGVLP